MPPLSDGASAGLRRTFPECGARAGGAGLIALMPLGSQRERTALAPDYMHRAFGVSHYICGIRAHEVSAHARSS